MKNKIINFKNKLEKSGVVSKNDIQNFELQIGKNIVSSNINLNKFTNYPSNVFLNELKVCLESELGNLSPIESLPNYSFMYYNYALLNNPIITIAKKLDNILSTIKSNILESDIVNIPIIESFKSNNEFYEKLFRENLNLDNNIDSGLDELAKLVNSENTDCFLTLFDYLQNVRGNNLHISNLDKYKNEYFIDYLLNIKIDIIPLTWNRLFNYNIDDILNICSYVAIRLQNLANNERNKNHDPLPIKDIKALDCYEPSTIEKNKTNVLKVDLIKSLDIVTNNLISFSNSKDINVVINILSMINSLTGDIQL